MKHLLCSLLLLTGTLGGSSFALEQSNSTSEAFYQRHKAALKQQFGPVATEADLRFLLRQIIDHRHLEVDYNQYFRPNPAPLVPLVSQRHAGSSPSRIKSDLVYPLLRFVLPRMTAKPAVSTDSPLGERIAAQAYGYLGIPYGVPTFNRQTGRGTLDCSGLVRYVFEDLGVGLRDGNSVAGMVGSADLKPVVGEPRPGDLLVRKHSNDRWSHVGIYIGNRQLIEAPYTGTVVRVTPYQSAKWDRTLRYVER